MTGRHEDLRMVAGACKLFRARKQRRFQRLRIVNRGAKHPRAKFMEAARRSVHDHEPELGEDRSQEFGERLSKRSSLLLRVTLAEEIRRRTPPDKLACMFQSALEPR